MFSQQLSKAWGLYRKDTSNAVPLKELDISIKVFHNIARVTYSQDYFNDTDVLLETEFFFPISPDACFDSFQATFNNTTIKGVVKEKEKAKEEYKEAIEQGRTAAYSEINKETGDIMKIQIGNIPQNTNISITYSYVQKLETSLNKFWCFRLFSTLTPRYNNMSNLKDFLSHDVTLLGSYPTISKDNANAYPWKIQVEIHSPSPISFIKSPSHDIIPTYGNEKHTCSISLNPQEKHFPNKDFILLYSNGKEGSLDYLLTPFEDGYCAMVSMIADFYKGTNEQAFDNFVKAKEVENEHSMSTIRGEYIFLIDRSGSMQGDRITMARNSLVLFLKSLPKDSFFNVVSFGSSYTFLHNSSVAYSQESIDSSTRQIQRFDADMGGTEIYHALQKIFTTPPKPGYPRFVFLLTDGAVSNTQQVLDLILANNNTTRTFTIGVGNGCSPELITKGAAYGRGKEEFVTDNNQIFEKVISLLNASLSPCYSDLSLHADNFDAVVKSVSPNPASIPFLINGQTVTFFLFLRKEAFQDSQKMNLQLRMYDSRIQKQHTLEICLDASEAFENEMISKLGIHDMIKRLENETDKASDNKAKEIMWMTKEDLKQALLEYSLKYGILCKATAFFCEISDNGEDFKNIVPAKVVIPTILSKDYETLHSTNISSKSINSHASTSSQPKSFDSQCKRNSTNVVHISDTVVVAFLNSSNNHHRCETIRNLPIDQLLEEPRKLRSSANKLAYQESAHKPFINALLKPSKQWNPTNDRKFLFKKDQIAKLIDEAMHHFANSPDSKTVLHIKIPVKIYGSLHGRYGHLLRLFDQWGSPTEDGDIEGFDYLFLGNYIDHGQYNLEVLCLLLALKLKYPQQFHLIRGSHEDININRSFGFGEECAVRLGEDINDVNSIFQRFNRLFEYLPMAAVIQKRVICLHSGIGNSIHSIQELENIQRPIQVVHHPMKREQQIVLDVLWSDPVREEASSKVIQKKLEDGVKNTVKFSPDRLKKFLTDNSLMMMLRSHECVVDGFEGIWDGSLITVFSVTDYWENSTNAAAVMVIKKNFEIIPKVMYSPAATTGLGIQCQALEDEKEKASAAYGKQSNANWIDTDKRPATPPRGVSRMLKNK